MVVAKKITKFKKDKDYDGLFHYVLDCYEKEDYKEPFDKYHVLFNLAECYLHGRGCVVDGQKAYELFSDLDFHRNEFMSEDYMRIRNGMGICYLYGYGVKQDYKQAIKWLQYVEHSSVSDGVVKGESYYYLGLAYEKTTPSSNYKQIMNYYQLAMDNDYEPAKEKLRDYAFECSRVDRMHEEEHLQFAADLDHKEALEELLARYSNSFYYRPNTAIKYGERLLALGNESYYVYSKLMENYKNICRYEKAKKMAFKLIDLGYEETYLDLASICFKSGEDYIQYIKEDTSFGKFLLSCHYYYGYVVDQDYKKARDLLNEAFKDENISFVYEYRIKDFVDMLMGYCRDLSQLENHIEAQFLLGNYYYHHKSTDNYKKAKQYLKKVVDNTKYNREDLKEKAKVLLHSVQDYLDKELGAVIKECMEKALEALEEAKYAGSETAAKMLEVYYEREK